MMILVTGGAFQGKTTYICQNLLGPNNKNIVDGNIWDPARDPEPSTVDHLESFIRNRLEIGESKEEILQTLLLVARKNQDIIWEIREIGCGIVPMDPMERKWRESTGRIGCELAKEAGQVYRVCSGIGVRIKG